MSKTESKLPRRMPSELFHYTTLANLSSILDENPEKRCLWATHFGFVNDSSEAKAYFDKRLPTLLKEFFGPSDHGDSANVKASRELELAFSKSLEMGISTVIEPYIVSFSGASNTYVKENGLLSQWRAYGADGGCALVFKASDLKMLAKKETLKYQYSGVNLCTASYYNHKNHKYDNSEMKNFEAELLQVLKNLVAGNGKNVLSDTLIPLVELSTRHKHCGFKEEREFRIIALPRKREHVEKGATSRLPVDTSFYLRKGSLVPHLKLFLGEELPITRIIIGPHINQSKRVEAVKKLLEQRNLEHIYVEKSDIPYIG